MNDQNNQIPDPVKSESDEAVTKEPQKSKKKLPKKVKIAIIAGSAILVAAAIALLLIFVVFKHEHSWSEWETVKAATCTEKGEEQHTCDCGEVEKKAVWPEHKWDEKAKCGAEQKCLACGETRINPNNHRDLNSPYDHICDYCGEAECLIDLPTTPTTLNVYNYNGSLEASVTLTDIKYKMGSTSPIITWSAERTYHENGSNYSDHVQFGWKIYDADGYVVDSGTAYSDGGIKVGEKVRDQSFEIYGLTDWASYKLELYSIK